VNCTASAPLAPWNLAIAAQLLLHTLTLVDEAPMSDDKSNRGSPDRDRIDIHDPNELHYWTKALNVSEEKLKDTVGQFGPVAKTVREALSHR
jgi:hypothetical protein